MGAHAGRAAHPALPAGRAADRDIDGKYSGSVTVRLGPIKLAFDGQADCCARTTAHRLAGGSGSDPRGAAR